MAIGLFPPPIPPGCIGIERERMQGLFEAIIKAGEINCPVCGHHCVGKGGHGCIDKATIYDHALLNYLAAMQHYHDKIRSNANRQAKEKLYAAGGGGRSSGGGSHSSGGGGAGGNQVKKKGWSSGMMLARLLFSFLVCIVLTLSIGSLFGGHIIAPFIAGLLAFKFSDQLFIRLIKWVMK